ncbi:hypothetical protein [Mesorhizobium caraganae]|uniref:hypothetical protein n=1 Tax=Mesorhizobium caraganae TaxID=483206 RepID=UPI00333554D3
MRLVIRLGAAKPDLAAWLSKWSARYSRLTPAGKGQTGTGSCLCWATGVFGFPARRTSVAKGISEASITGINAYAHRVKRGQEKLPPEFEKLGRLPTDCAGYVGSLSGELRN